VLRTFSLILALAAVAWPASPTAKRKPTKHRPQPVTSHSAKAPAGKAVSVTAKNKGKKTKRVTRYSQQAPTQERYREIQQALVSKGYLQGEPNGEWGPAAVDALKRFQADQNLTPDGKLNSISLIALGLGPKRLTSKSTPQSPAEVPR
jgi:peptidoglycan hydrolase-like protein with peptidoglycan-binding domain